MFGDKRKARNVGTLEDFGVPAVQSTHKLSDKHLIADGIGTAALSNKQQQQKEIQWGHFA